MQEERFRGASDGAPFRLSWAPEIVVQLSPNFDTEPFAPKGIVVHGTDSGLVRSVQDEFASSVAWLTNPASRVSAHSVAGPGTLARLVLPPERAWHSRLWNDHLGIELTHAIVAAPLDEPVLQTAAWECAKWVTRYGIPLVWGIDVGFCEHRENPSGIADGKVDVATWFDHADFLARVAAFVG